MSLKSQIDKLVQDHDEVVFRPSQLFTLALGAVNIFTINGGPVEIKLIVGRVTAAFGAAGSAATVQINGVAAMVAGLVVGAAAIGDVLWVPGLAAGVAVIGPKVDRTVASITSVIAAPSIAAAPPGLITYQATINTSTFEWYVVYRRLNPSSQVNIA